MSAAPLRHPRPIPQASPRTAPSRGAAARPAARRREHLRAVAAPEQARTLVPFAWTCALIVVAALTAVLLLNTSMARGAYERRDLKIEIASLHEQHAVLVTALEQKSSPDELARDAQTLGMQPAAVMGFVSLADRVVIESGGR